MAGPTQPVKIGEDLSDDRIRSLVFPEGGIDPAILADYQVLTKAYKTLRDFDFERFLAFYVEAGRDVNARDPQGQTFLDRISGHARSGNYASALRAAGGKLSGEL